MIQSTLFSFRAFGHPNIAATHPTTLELTTESHVTLRGDCILGVRASCPPSAFPSSIRQAMSTELGRAVLRIRAAGQCFEVHGHGSPSLTFQEPREMVVRKSRFPSHRTIMVNADKAARDIPREMLGLLRNPEQQLEIEIELIQR